MRSVILIGICALLMCNLRAQEVDTTLQKASLLFIGDIMGHDAQIIAAMESDSITYNYDDVFTYIEPTIAGADLSIANLEVTLDCRPFSGYPSFSSPVELATACKNAGIDCLVTANNHSCDRRLKGIERTISVLDSLGIKHTGTYLNPQEKITQEPLILEANNIRVALLNYTYGTNGIPVPAPTVVNLIHRDSISNDIKRARTFNPDVLITFFHWGDEYSKEPNGSQQELAQFCFDAGADIVIGSHPHVVQKMDWTQDESGVSRLVVYSLGNFVSNQRRAGTDGGMMARIDLTKDSSGVVRIDDAGYYLTWVYTPYESGKKRFRILPVASFHEKPEFFDNRPDYEKMMQFAGDARRILSTGSGGVREFTGLPAEASKTGSSGHNKEEPGK